MFICHFFLSIILFLYSFSNENKENNILIKRALNNDKSIFINEYLANSFNLWKKRLNLNENNFKIDSTRSNQNEIYVNIKLDKLNCYTIIFSLIYEKNKKAFISDIRRIVPINKNHVDFINDDLKNFIEQFAWKYDVGDKNLLLDLIFSDMIHVSYKGETKTQKALENVRHDFPFILPAVINKPDTLGQYIIINIGPRAQLNPILLSVNLKKYYTEYFQNIYGKFLELKDSIRIWQHLPDDIKLIEKEHEKGISPENVVADILSENFSGYAANIDGLNESYFFEVYLSPYYNKFISPILRYKLKYLKGDKDNLSFEYKLVESEENEKIYDKLLENIKSNLTKKIYKKIFKRNLYFYSTIHLPQHLMYQPKNYCEPDISIVLHQTTTDTLSIISFKSMNKILKKIAFNHIVYYFINKYSIENNIINVTGYSIYQNRKLLLHHFLKIRDQYIISDSTYTVKKITIDIYPFIRTDNVKSIFAEDNEK